MHGLGIVHGRLRAVSHPFAPCVHFTPFMCASCLSRTSWSTRTVLPTLQALETRTFSPRPQRGQGRTLIKIPTEAPSWLLYKSPRRTRPTQLRLMTLPHSASWLSRYRHFPSVMFPQFAHKRTGSHWMLPIPWFHQDYGDVFGAEGGPTVAAKPRSHGSIVGHDGTVLARRAVTSHVD